jgi:hypothetical protein
MRGIPSSPCSENERTEICTTAGLVACRLAGMLFAIPVSLNYHYMTITTIPRTAIYASARENARDDNVPARVVSSCNIRPLYSTRKNAGEGGAEGSVHSDGQDDQMSSFWLVREMIHVEVFEPEKGMRGRKGRVRTYHSPDGQFGFKGKDVRLARDHERSQMTLLISVPSTVC